MTDKPQAGVLGGLPRTRPHRRSAKRTPAGPSVESVAGDAKPTASTADARSRAKGPVGAKTPAKAKATPAKAKPPPAKAKPKATPAKAKATRAKAAQAGGQGAHHTQPRTQAPRSAASEPGGSATDPAAGPLGTAVQAAAELAEIGLTAGARAVRGALSRLPRR